MESVLVLSLCLNTALGFLIWRLLVVLSIYIKGIGEITEGCRKKEAF